MSDNEKPVTTDTGVALDLTPAELAEVQADRTPVVDEPAAPPTAEAVDDADAAPEPEQSDIRTLAAAATQAAQAATAAAQELAASRQQASAPAPALAAPAEPDWAAERAALKTKYDAGEMDEDEYENARENLIERKADYNAAKRVDEVVNKRLAQQQAQDADRQWDSALASFNATPENATFTTDPVRAAAFQAVLSAVAKENPKATYTNWLETARDRVATAFGMTKAPAADTQALKKATTDRAAARSAPPPDLTRAPSAGVAPADNNFASLDSLPVSDLEDRLAALYAKNPGAVEAYLADAPGGLRDNPRAA